jgi:hypothetical protein
MLVKYPGLYCYTWSLLAQQGLPEDKEWTPFLFVNSDARANVTEFITNEGIVSLGDVADYL